MELTGEEVELEDDSSSYPGWGTEGLVGGKRGAAKTHCVRATR